MRRLSGEVLQAPIDSSDYFHSRIGFISSKHDVETKADSSYSSLMKDVYLIRSESLSHKTYIGVTSNLSKRLAIHNSGGSTHTSKFKPWKLITYMAFSEDSKALAFERYLKTGSGRAFAKKRFW
jgi:putative endonuclease